jgi:hypothetical protein
MLRHATNELEMLCARLNRELGEIKERVIISRSQLKEHKQRKINIRTYAEIRRWKVRYLQLTKDLDTAENDEERIRRQLNGANVDFNRIRNQLSNARGEHIYAARGGGLLSIGTTRNTSIANHSIRRERTSVNEPQIYITRPDKSTQATNVDGLHKIWR